MFFGTSTQKERIRITEIAMFFETTNYLNRITA